MIRTHTICVQLLVLSNAKNSVPTPPRRDNFIAMTIETMRKLPRSEKLKLLEALWEDLSRSEREFESPPWHERELADTERRLAAGKERVIDWQAAKKALRKKSQ
jgi:hypothetical protein